MRSSGSAASAGSAHCTAWPVPRCSAWCATSMRAGAVARVERGADRLELVAEDDDDAPAPAARAFSTAHTTSGRPATWCRTLARSLFMRVPRPAARTTTMGCDIASEHIPSGAPIDVRPPPRLRVHPRLLPRLAAAVAVMGLGGGVAHAHQASATFSRMETTGDPARLKFEIRISARDLYEILELDDDREASADEIRRGQGDIMDYVTDRLEFDADGADCSAEPVAVEPIEQGQRFARVELAVVCPAPIRTLGARVRASSSSSTGVISASCRSAAAPSS